jgi:hypothetical protein
VADKLKPSSEAFRKRQLIWKHNGFKGSAKMIEMQALAIVQSETATDKSKALAYKIVNDARNLGKSLNNRVGP